MARILLVDDDRDIRVFAKALLAQEGHEVFTADSALEAVDLLRDHPIDMLITDANMPHYSGFDLLQTLKHDDKFSDMSVVMLTGRRERKDIERALACGAHDYIVKPLDPMLFLKKVSDLLTRKPPTERAEIDFAKINLNQVASLKTNIEILSISELGLLLYSPHQLAEGSRIEIAGDVFSEIGLELPLMKVISCIQRSHSPTVKWEVRVSFIGADEATLTKIRAWIHSYTIRNAVKAAS